MRFAAAPQAVADLGPINHSCEPTLGWTDERTLIAMRDIAAGEELTVDYATAIDDPDYVLLCHCETYRCRQVIEGTDWQIPQLQQRYAGHWHPAVQTPHRRGRLASLAPMVKFLLALHLVFAVFAIGPLVHAATTAGRGIRTATPPPPRPRPGCCGSTPTSRCSWSSPASR